MKPYCNYTDMLSPVCKFEIADSQNN